MSAFELLAAFPAAFTGVCLVLGLMVGSFLNVVIYRLPLMLERQWREECAENAPPGDALEGSTSSAAVQAACVAEMASADGATDLPGTAPAPAAKVRPEPFNLVVPRSACPACRAPIRAIHNIPLLSWLLLRGRCASCGAPISARYPLIEALTGLLSALVAWKFGFGWAACAALVLTWFLIALTFIDIDHQLLPDSLTLPLLWLGLLLSLWTAQGAGAALPVDTRSSVIGAMTGYVSLWSVYHLFRLLTGKDGMGYGDFKLFAALGAWLGWQMLLPIILIASGIGAIVGLALIALRRQSRSTPIPFGPFLAGAGWLMLMFGQPVITGYLGLAAALH
ncbi:MAG TPA: A24 family peptidase [Steroidobacteraceae bacterium]|jgi:leader peptidase (prepilin peptidase)/N-methyltransferase|nr:A24 family peptidase [Steroidobacteraceae bacterium]